MQTGAGRPSLDTTALKSPGRAIEQRRWQMSSQTLPCGTWLVIAHNGPDRRPVLISRHANCREAEAERDRRNRGAGEFQFQACMVLEPIAQRMGGRQSPAAQP